MIVIELLDEIIIIGCISLLMDVLVVVILNVVKYLVYIVDDIFLLLLLVFEII